MAGGFGLFGALSFYPTKNLGALGDAGAVLTTTPNTMNSCASCGFMAAVITYYHDRVGGNFRIDAIQAAMLSIKLKHLEQWTEQRRARAGRYTELLQASGLVPERLQTPNEVRGRHVYHQYVIRATQRDELAQFLKQRQDRLRSLLSPATTYAEVFRGSRLQAKRLPRAQQAAAEVLALPIYPELSEDQQQAVGQRDQGFLQ